MLVVGRHARLRGLETLSQWFGTTAKCTALDLRVGEPVTYVQVSPEAKGLRGRLRRFF